MASYISDLANSVNEWATRNENKTFEDSYGVKFNIVGADAKGKAGSEFLALQVKHENGEITSRPLSAFKTAGESIRFSNLINTLNSVNKLEGKSTYDITDRINSWVKKNPYKIFIDKSGVGYVISGAKPPETLMLTSESGLKVEKKISSMTFSGQQLTMSNAYEALTQATGIDNQVFYGNIVDAINNWAQENDKQFQNGEGTFKVTGAMSKNGATLIQLENEMGIKKAVALNSFVYENQKMTIGNALELLNKAKSFDNTIRFGDKIELANEWLKKENPTYTDKNGTKFKIEKVFRDKDSQIKFQVRNQQGQTVERNAYSFVYNLGQSTIQGGNIVGFLQGTRRFENAVLFDNAWQQGRPHKSEENPHYLPPFESLKVNDGFRLPNGQCAMVTGHGVKASNGMKTIDIVVEDGTHIKNISQNRYEGGLINLNTNRPILNALPTIHDGQYDDKDIRREMRQMLSEKQATGNRSGIEFKYLYYLQQFGFKETQTDFFESHFKLNERRLPDSFMLKDGKMVIFEFDGGGGHGGVYRPIAEDVRKDNEKNALYQSIIRDADAGKYKPEIDEVMVIRVRGNSVPKLNPKGIVEINYPHCSNEELMIPEMIQSIAYQIDKQFGFDFSSQLYGKYPEGISIREDADELFDFVEEQFGRKSSDPRVGAISQTVGFGDDKNRLGQFMMITKVEAKNPGELSPNDKVHVIFEDGRRTKTSYEKFVDGTVHDSKFNKIIDCSSRKFEYTTAAQAKKQMDYAYAIRYCDEKPIMQAIKDDVSMTMADIAKIRLQFPIRNGVIVNGTEAREAVSFASLLRKAGLRSGEKDVANDVLEGAGTHGIRHPSFNWNGRDDR